MALQNSYNKTLPQGTRFALGGDAAGDIYYRAASGEIVRLAIGANGQLLVASSGVPSWQSGAPPGGNAGGDLAGTYPNPTIANNAVSYAKLQNLSQSGVLLGRATAGSGVVEELQAATARSLLGLGTAALATLGTAPGQLPALDAGGKLPAGVMPAVTLGSIQVVANEAARLALTNVDVGSDVVKQSDTGVSWVLMQLPASTAANWVSIGDTQIDASDIASGLVATARLGTGTASSSTYLRGDQTWQPVPSGLPAVLEATGNVTAQVNTSHIANSATLLTVTLPATVAQGSYIRIVGKGSGGWRVALSAGQVVHFGNVDTTTGTAGRLDSTHRYDSVTLECITAGSEFSVIASQGNIDVV